MKVFPCAKFVINYRQDIKAQHKSEFQKKIKISELTNVTKSLIDFANLHKNNMFQFPLEDFGNLNKWNELFSFLDRDQCKAKSVIHSNNGKSNGYNVDQHKAVECLNKE